MLSFNEESEIEINIYKWKHGNRVEIEIEYGGISPFEITVKNMAEADIFVRALKKSKVTKYKVNEDGSVEN